MNMVVDLISQILEAAQVGETADWEFKSAKGGLPGSFWETYSAFANTEGGTLILGAREEADGSVQLDGLSSQQINDYQKTLWDLLNNRGKVSRNLLSNDDVQVVPLDNLYLLAVHVPRATRANRPVYLNATPFGNSYRRQHEGDYRCSDDEVRRLLADADPLPADQRILLGFTLSDLDSTSLTQYRQRLRAVRGEHAWLSLEDRDLLERLGGWRKDRVSGSAGITLAGLLMFGKDTAIRDPEAAPAYFVDYREKLDTDVRWSDRVYPDGIWEANLFQFYQRAWPKLSAGLPIPFRLEGGMRKDETPVHEALREAFVNALIHADYSAPGGVVVERYADRFVLENPGTLLVSQEQFRRGGVSDCRNKSLQKMFLMIGGGEQAGSGVDKIREGWRSQHWRVPFISVTAQPDRVRLTMSMVSLIPPATLEHLRTLFGLQIDDLIPAEVQALATAEIEGAVSNARLQELLNNHPVDITRMLMGLCARGFLISDNRRRWTTYRLGTARTEPTLFDVLETPSEGNSSGMGGDSSHKSPDSSHLEDQMDLLRAIADPIAKTGKASPDSTTAAILNMCQGRYLTAELLGQLLNRNANGLRNRFLTPLVEGGKLRLRYPASANRPDQAYITASTEE